MAIVSGDLLFFQSERMNDSPTGGGLITGLVAQDGAANNVFADVSPSDRAAGALHLRRVYGALMSANADQLSAAAASIFELPADEDIDCLLIADSLLLTGGAADRAAVARVLTGTHPTGAPVEFSAANTYPLGHLSLVYAGVSSTVIDVTSPNYVIRVGDVLRFGVPATDELTGVQAPSASLLRTVDAVSVAGDVYTCTMASRPGDSTMRVQLMMPTRPGRYGAAVTTASASSGASVIEVDSVFARVCEPGQGSILEETLDCRTTKFFNGQTIVLRNGATVGLAVIKQVHLGGEIDLTAPLAATWPSGTKVAGLLDLGDWRAATTGVAFGQQTWTKTWSDALIGNGISARYNLAGYPFACRNDGSETDRLAFVFTTTTEFDLYSQRHGLIASGNTGEDFAPINPRTGAVFFTVDSAGWGGGWARGNVWRINTVGAHGGFWVARHVTPGAAGTSDEVVLELRGSA